MEPIRCRLCETLPALEVAPGYVLCGDCRRTHELAPCPGCGVTALEERGGSDARCPICDARARLEMLPRERLAALDALVRDGEVVAAALLLLRGDPTLGIGDAKQLAEHRRVQLAGPRVPTRE